MKIDNKEIKVAGISCIHDVNVKYFDGFLQHLSKVCDSVWILDDRSTCAAFIKERCAVYGAEYIRSDEPFHGGRIWRTLYSKLESFNPDWVIAPDSDEFIEHGMETKLLKMLVGTADDVNAYSLPILYMYNDDKHYRIDGWYKTARVVRVFRYFKDKLPADVPRHATSLPENIGKIQNCDMINVLHYSYKSKQDRLDKYDFYMKRDKDMVEKGEASYEHFLNENVELAELK